MSIAERVRFSFLVLITVIMSSCVSLSEGYARVVTPVKVQAG